MVYINRVQLLVTSSTDKTMRVWRIDKARQLLFYPWFVRSQTISDFDTTSYVGIWLNCFDYKITENLQFFAGDSEGSIYCLEAPVKQSDLSECYFRLASKSV